MVTTIIIGLIEVIAVLLILKSGWILSFLENVPFIGVIGDVVGALFGLKNQNPLPPGSAHFAEEFLKAILFIIIYYILDNCMNALFHTGKHGYEPPRFSSGKHARSRFPLVKGFLVSIASAIFTCLIMEVVYSKVQGFLAGYAIWFKALLSVGFIGLLVVLFLFLKAPFHWFCVWLVGKIIFPTVVKILAVLFAVISLYYLLNIPGMFDQVGTIVILLFGIGCCIGSVFGVELFESKFDDQWDSSRNSRH